MFLSQGGHFTEEAKRSGQHCSRQHCGEYLVVVESRQQCREHSTVEHRSKLPLHKAANQLRADQITCKNKYMHVQAYGVRVVFLEHGNLSWHLLASRRFAPEMLDHLPYYICLLYTSDAADE